MALSFIFFLLVCPESARPQRCVFFLFVLNLTVDQVKRSSALTLSSPPPPPGILCASELQNIVVFFVS